MTGKRGSIVFPPQSSIQDPPNVLAAMREMLSQRPRRPISDSYDLAGELRARGYLTHRPHEVEVVAALEALLIEGEVLP
jgi:hypothetical protein